MRRAIITILGLICAVLMGYGIAHAGTSAYLTLESSGAGYDAGYGVRIEHMHRFNRFALHGQIGAALQHKHGAESGYTYGARGEARWFFVDPFYLSAGYGGSGYRSEFASGAVWEKHGWQPHVGAGYDGERVDVWAKAFRRENGTPNRVMAQKIGAAWKFNKKWKVMAEATYMSFDQSNERKSDWLCTFGFGLEF
jgi:hypothetical protein